MSQNQPDMTQISELVFDRYDTVGHENLSQPERVFLCVWRLEDEVNNGGFDQYYFNSSGDQVHNAATSLEAIGAKHTASLVRQANALFGEAGPSPNRSIRQDQLDALSDAAMDILNELDDEFYKYVDPLDELLQAYVSQHAETFQGLS
ncbi:DMP19 family protein [Planctomycetales bacterium ZRK34]|nr:DMP19 family protein [Planctomycetales bacterium ZRK34]